MGDSEGEFYCLPAGGATRRPLVVSFNAGGSPDRPNLLPLVCNLAQASSNALKRALPIAQQTAEALREFARKRPQVAAPEPSVPAAAPWSVMHERFSILEPVLRERILALSGDENVFAPHAALSAPAEPTAPEAGQVPMARAALDEDPRLQQLRYKLVPAVMAEAAFWRCYFTAVVRIRHELLVDYSALSSQTNSAGSNAPQTMRTNDDGSTAAALETGAGIEDAQRAASSPLSAGIIAASGSDTKRAPAEISPLLSPQERTSTGAARPVLTAVDSEWEAMLREELDCFSPHLPPSMRTFAADELDALLK